jgi:hypothetical protein
MLPRISLALRNRTELARHLELSTVDIEVPSDAQRGARSTSATDKGHVHGTSLRSLSESRLRLAGTPP